MRSKFIGIFAALLFVLALFGMSASVERNAAPAVSTIRKTTIDTITNAEKDTLAVAGTLLSPYYYNIQGFRTSLSGTHNVKVYLDQSAVTSGDTDWIAVDSTSTTTATLFALRGTAYGIRYRIRMSGTGSQSSRYGVTYVFKPLN